MEWEVGRRRGTGKGRAQQTTCVKADMGKCLTLKSKEKTYVGRAPQRTGIGEGRVIRRDQREWDFADSVQRSFLLLLLQ